MKARNLFGVVCLIAVAMTGGIPGAGARVHAQTARSQATLTAHASTVTGTVRDAVDKPIPAARLRLRDLNSGRILMTTRGDQEGRFRFAGVPAGTYLVELVDDTGSVLALGHAFTMPPGETLATFIRLAARAPWYRGFFSNAAVAAVSSAAGLGLTAVGTGVQPASGRF